ncbi:MAG TPA: cyclodeaminase/cyclohydrolase family protein [Terriglobales bacterium]|jgi:formiminotetrahydrofolate cyclodeaminase|nr:cyclodeaminase/cyclohydrolase family protein [Terriglobales bacterium]
MVKDNNIELFLDDLASRKPTPSGGSAAAVMGAMGAALVSMVCNLTIGKTQYRDFEEEFKSVLTKAEELRRDLTKMIEEDVQAFDAVMRAYGMPRLTKDETATRAQAIQTALKTATLVPMRCCRACREVITLGSVVAEKGNRNVISDAGVAAVAAYAALRSAALNVFTNARAITDRIFAEDQLAELEQLLSQAATATETSYQVVKEKLG